MKRTIIKIDEKLCNGCGACVKGCHEGALQLIDGKAVMVSELYCDGLGACIGECPVGAICLEEREAEPYDEKAVSRRLIPKGREVACGCPGSRAQMFTPLKEKNGPLNSELRQFPVQLHLLNPQSGFFQGADLLLAADCTAFASGEFHRRFLKGKMLAIGCPKLDQNIQSYIHKLIELIDVSMINTMTVLTMEVPCCEGLLRIAEAAREQAKRNVPLKIVVLSVRGEVKREEWMSDY